MCVLGHTEGLLIYELYQAAERGVARRDFYFNGIIGAPDKLGSYFYVINGKCPGLVWSTAYHDNGQRDSGRYYLKWFAPPGARVIKGSTSRRVKAAVARLLQ